MTGSRSHGLGTLAGFVPLCLAASVAAQEAPDFRGRTMTMLIGSDSAGGYDLYGRLVARHLGAHLPGRPTLVVQNMPGAGGLIGANYLYNVAAKDGSVIGTVPQAIAIGQVLGTSGGKYDARGFVWIGRVNSNVEIEHSWTASGVTSIEVAKRREVVVAGTGPLSSSLVFPRLLNALIGTRFKIVPGYESANGATLALERGEVEAIVRPWSVIKSVGREWLEDGKITLLVQYAVGRHPELPSLPAVVDLAETPEQRQIFSLYASGSDIGRSIVAPPGVPPAVIPILRAAFMATMRDPALIEEAAKGNIDLDPLDGAALQKVVESTLDVAPATVARAKALTEEGK